MFSYGSYVPYRRLKRSAIAQVLGTPPAKANAQSRASTKIVSRWRSKQRATRSRRRQPAPSRRFSLRLDAALCGKLNAALIGAATRLPGEIRASDSTGSVRAGMSALLQAGRRGQWWCKASAGGDGRLQARGARRQSRTDHRRPALPRSLLGNDNVLAEIVATSSLTREFLDSWRAPGDRFAHSWEERFALTQAYSPLLGDVIKNILEKAKVAPGDIAKIILDAPNPRAADEISRALKLDPRNLPIRSH